MVKHSETFWTEKIAEIRNHINKSVSECSSFLLDLLQGLYEDVSETTKVDLLLVLQEHGETLIQRQELAEQAVGSIKNILTDLLWSQKERNFFANCLVTSTTLIIQFDLDQFNPHLVRDITHIFIEICKRVNNPGETVIRKIACECLFELETAIPLILAKCLYLLYDLAKEEKSFSSQSYMLLLSTALSNCLQLNEVDFEDVAYDQGLNMAVSKITQRDGQQMTSFIAGELSHMAPIVLWRIGKKLGFLFKNLRMPRVVLQNVMMQCISSSDLQVLHLGLYLGICELQGLIMQQDLYFIAKCLLRIIGLPVFPNGVLALCLEWLHEVVQHANFADNVADLIGNAFQDLVRNLVFDSVTLLRGKFDLLSSLLTIHPNSYSYLKCLEIPIQIVTCGANGPYTTLLYRALYLRYTQTEEKAEKESIGELVTHVTLKIPLLIQHTIDFVISIKSESSEREQTRKARENMIHKISSFILKLPKEEFFIDASNYFPLIELACAEKGLWPLGIIKWLRFFCLKPSVCNKFIIDGYWNFGSDILSICRAVLGSHDSVLILQELADLLWFIHKQFPDHDIRDRALFYYMIIGHASPKYFEKLFAKPDVSASMQSISRRTELEIPADLVKGVLPTIRFDRNFLAFEKTVEKETQRVQYCKESIYKDVEAYKRAIDEHFEKGIRLQLKIKFAAKINEEESSKIYALTIKLNAKGKCDDIPDILIPYLCNQQDSSISSNMQLIYLKVCPWDTAPFSILVSCTFTNSQRRICVAPAERIQLSFSDFFHPLLSAYDDTGDSEKATLFVNLWSHFEKNQRTAESEQENCALSVKRLKVKDQCLKSALDTKLKPFYIEETANRFKIGIFLSPACHLLMDFEVSKEETLVKLCVDNWKLLDLVDDFLEALVIE